jgi:membrane protease YdiL (CAAX protease family)
MPLDAIVESRPGPSASAKRDRVPLALLWCAAILPTAAALIYFAALRDHPAAPFVYAASKVVQFLLPLCALAALSARPLRGLLPWSGRRPEDHARSESASPSRRAPRVASAVWAGVGTGCALAATIIATRSVLDSSSILREVSAAVAQRMASYSLDGAARYLAFALFLSFAHSALEEYYWRWFLLGGLMKRGTSSGSAIWLSSLAFTAHHVVVVVGFVPRQPGLIVLGSAGVLAAGLVWAWLFLRWKGVLAPWASHVVVDLAVLALGWELVTRGGMPNP